MAVNDGFFIGISGFYSVYWCTKRGYNLILGLRKSNERKAFCISKFFAWYRREKGKGKKWKGTMIKLLGLLWPVAEILQSLGTTGLDSIKLLTQKKPL